MNKKGTVGMNVYRCSKCKGKIALWVPVTYGQWAHAQAFGTVVVKGRCSLGCVTDVIIERLERIPIDYEQASSRALHAPQRL